MKSNSQIFHAVGVVLKAIPFKEQDKIVTLFTRDAGSIKLFMRGSYLRAPVQNVLSEPLTHGEYFFTQGRGELFHFYDGSIIGQNLHLRTSLEKLQVAEKMTQAILNSQWPEKSSPALYQLLCLFLHKLEHTESVDVVLGCFLLKILSHDGLLQMPLLCSSCQKELETRWRYGGESFCEAHAPRGALTLTMNEERVLKQMVEAKSFQEMTLLPFSKGLKEKVESLFSQAI